MATVQKRSNRDGSVSYRAMVRLKGFPMETATFERKTDARRWAEQTESAMREGRYFKTSESKRHTLREAIDRYIKEVLPSKAQNSRHSQQSQLEWWGEKLGHLSLADVTPQAIAAARDELAGTTTRFDRQFSGSTIVRYLAALSHVFTFG